VEGRHVEFFPSTQNVSGIGGDLSNTLEDSAYNVHVHMDNVGGGSAASASDRWGIEAAQLSKQSAAGP